MLAFSATSPGQFLVGNYLRARITAMKFFPVKTLLALLALTAGLLSGLPLALAEDGCPKIHNLIDFNCDGEFKVVFTGDSIVKGVGDTLRPIEGYPGRLQDAWPWADINNLGVPGATSSRLLRDIKKLLIKRPKGTTDRKSVV